MPIRVINMIPQSLSGETSQDSEPNLAVNPANPTDIVGTAFTPSPTGGSFAPIYVSTDGGLTWSLRNVVPGNGSFGTGDITVGFATTGGRLYAGILNGSNGRMQLLRTSSFTSTSAMTVLVDRGSEDQPWVVAGSVVVGGTSRDRVYVGSNNFALGSQSACVDRSLDAATAAAPAGFAPFGIERRATSGQDGPPVRLALHPDGTIYAAFHRWVSGSVPNITMDVVVTRDDSWATGSTPFDDLVDSGDGEVGQRVATGRFIKWNATMGQERLGGDLTIAVDPVDSDTVWVAWCDRVGGTTGTDWTVHVRRSTNRGQSWSADVRTITNAKNPSLAVNASRRLALLYQQFDGSRWITHLELTSDGWTTAADDNVLHRAPSATPARTFLPYLGDYTRLLAVGDHFYGVFSGNNTPDMANFPSGVTYQRNANFTTHTLLNTNNVSPVAVSIDPFFFHHSPLLTPIIGPNRGVIPRGTVVRGPIHPIRGIDPGPITPVTPIRGPIDPGPLKPPGGGAAGGGAAASGLKEEDAARLAREAMEGGGDLDL